MAPEPRLGFEMTLLRMLAFRPDTAHGDDTHGRRLRSRRPRRPRRQPRRSPLRRPRPRARRAGFRPAAAQPVDRRAYVARRGRGGEPERHGAPVCVELRAGLVRERCAQFAARSGGGRAARAPHRGQAPAGLQQVSGPRHSHRLRGLADAPLATPARQRVIAEQDRASRAAAAFEEDPAVKGLRERFGAEVDAASVKPAN